MADFNHSIKKIKVAELSDLPFKKHNSSQKIFYRTRKHLINVMPKTLSLQKMKRTKASRWNFDSEKLIKGFSKPLSQVIGHNKNVQELILYPNPRVKDLLNLTHGLKGLKSLKRITVDSIYYQITDEELHSLMKGLAGSHCLKNISLQFCCCEITDTSLEYASRSLKRMYFLEEIDLHFSSLFQATGKGLQKLNGSFNHLTRLKDITLETNDCPKLTDINLRCNFKKLTSLQRITIDFSSCGKLTDFGVIWIVLGLNGLPNLQQITFDFYYCHLLSDVSLGCIWRMMKTLSTLLELTLNFTSERITDAGFHDMNETLDSLASMQKIYFEFYHCPKITDNGLVSLCQALAKGVSLESLSLSFSVCNEITDLGVEEVVDCMNGLTHLQDAGIDFERCERLTDASLKKISQFLKSKTSLRTVLLGVSEMEEATQEGYDDFNEEIRALKLCRPDLSIDWR